MQRMNNSVAGREGVGLCETGRLSNVEIMDVFICLFSISGLWGRGVGGLQLFRHHTPVNVGYVD